MSTNGLDLAYAEVQPVHLAHEGTDSNVLRRRIAGLVRLLEARDRTICDLVSQTKQRSQNHPVPFFERSKVLDCALCPKTTESETVAAQFQAAVARLEKAEKMALIGQLAAGIAHELNTPIQYVNDNVLFLERAFDIVFRVLDKSRAIAADNSAPPIPSADDVDESELAFLRGDLPEALEQTRDGLRRIAEIVTAMKNFSHQSDEGIAPADLVDIVQRTVAVSRGEWKYVADVQTSFASDLGMVPCIRGDIEKVVLNLVVNAAHAIRAANENQPSVKGTIVVTIQRVGEFAEILVADSGNGIPEFAQQRIFDPFFTTKPVGVGTGQGLAIARTCIVERHHGELFFETEAGKGTTFHVRIPLSTPLGAL